MSLEDRMALCTYHYQKWKNIALTASSMQESRKALERAFFWLELQTAFITLFTMEKLENSNPNLKQKVIVAKTNLSKRLADYANSILEGD